MPEKGSEAVDPVQALDDQAEVSQLRRENERLVRKVRQLEERIRLASGPPEAKPERAADRIARRSNPGTGVPYDLPVVKVKREGDGPVRTTSVTSLGKVPNTGIDLDEDSHRPQAPVYASNESEFGAADAVMPAHDESAAVDADVQSFRLVGSSLVKATKSPPKQKQRAIPAPSSSKKRSRRSNKDSVLGEYEAAMAVYRGGQFREAELAFDGIVRNSPSHEYADNALYWKGEASYDQAHFSDALASFTEVVERYGGGNKAPDALLKIGLCYGKLGDQANAHDVLSQLIAAYPRARATKIAKGRLADFSAAPTRNSQEG